MKILAIVFTILVGMHSPALHACSCDWGGPFVKSAARSGLVVYGKVIKYGRPLSHGEGLYSSMTVEVISVVKGELSNKRITIQGDRGADCSHYITKQRFEKNAEYLFALFDSDKKTQRISACGEYWIRIESGVAKGVDRVRDASLGFKEKPYTIPLTDLVEKINPGAELPLDRKYR